jgi:hypothetical protein
VINEHTLGYIYSERPNSVNVLAGSVIKGSPWSWLNTPAYCSAHDTLRDATDDDFKAFRVGAKGHIR